MNDLTITQEPGAEVTRPMNNEEQAPGVETEPEAIRGPASRFRRSLAVVIGIDTYGEGISPLRSAVADAKAIAEVLRRDQGFETLCLFDTGLQRLLAVLREDLPAALGPDDRLLFYFAGHGIALDSDAGPAGYLLPADVRRSKHEGFLPMHVLHDELAGLQVHHVLIILDCCFAGTFRWSSLRDVEPVASKNKSYLEQYNRYIESAAWQVLTSASGDQLALDMLANDRGEGTDMHSPFARALLEGLTGAADYNEDNVITADELAMFVRDRVAPVAEAVGRRQIPQLFPLRQHDSGQFVFQVPNRPLKLEKAPPLDENSCPYRGLESYLAKDHSLFFGRDTVTQKLVDAVVARSLTVVVGPSGCGKSSLVQAGLMPALEGLGWKLLPVQRPGTEPLAALNAWTKELGAKPMPDGPANSWVASIAAYADAHPDQPCLAIVDQLEELVTHRTTEHARSAFLDALASALKAAPSLHLVVTVRSDAEPQFHKTELEPWWTAGRFAVPAMTRDELRQTIEKPATKAVLYFEPSRLVERLIDDVALVPTPLPLLSFALSELYRQCWMRWHGGTRDRALREDDYRNMGSVAGALTQRATALHDQLVAKDPKYAGTIRNIITRMVTVVGGETARCRVPIDELEYDDPDENRRVEEVLQRFHDARLVSRGGETTRDGGTIRYAEPTHDELVRGWPRVSEWLDGLDATGATRALFAALAGGVHSWRAHQQADSYLWSDPRVELLDELGHKHPLVFNAGEARFIQRSARRRRSRRTWLIGGLLAMIVVLAAMAGAALWQRNRARRERVISEAGRLVAEAESLIDSEPDTAARNVLDAWRLNPTPDAERVARRWSSRRLTLVVRGLGQVMASAIAPNGSELAAQATLGGVEIFGFQTKWVDHLDWGFGEFVTAIAFSPKSKRLAAVGSGGTVRMWEHREERWELMWQLDGDAGYVLSARDMSLAWKNEDEVLISNGTGSGVSVLDAATGATKRSWPVRSARRIIVAPDAKHAAMLVGNELLVTDVIDADSPSREISLGIECPALAWGEHQIFLGCGDGHVLAFDSRAILKGGDDATRAVSSPAVITSLGRAITDLEVKNGVLVIGVADGTIEAFDPRRGIRLVEPVRAAGAILDIAVEGDAVNVSSGNGWLRVFMPEIPDDGSNLLGTSPNEHVAPTLAIRWNGFGRAAVGLSSGELKIMGTEKIPLSCPIQQETGRRRGLAWSPRGDQIAATFDARLVVFSVGDQCDIAFESEPLVQNSDAPPLLSSVSWSPDGSRLVTTAPQRGVIYWQSSKGVVSAEKELETVGIAAWEPSGQGRILGYSQAKRALVLWDPTDDHVLAELSVSADVGQGTTAVVLSWRPHKAEAVLSIDEGGLLYIDVAKQTVRWKLRERGAIATDVAWRADGRLAVVYADGSVVVLEPEAGRKVAEYRTSLTAGNTIAWTPDSRGLFVGGISGDALKASSTQLLVFKDIETVLKEMREYVDLSDEIVSTLADFAKQEMP